MLYSLFLFSLIIAIDLGSLQLIHTRGGPASHKGNRRWVCVWGAGTQSLIMNEPGRGLGQRVPSLFPVPFGSIVEPEIKGKITNTDPGFTVLMFLFIMASFLLILTS